MVWKKTNIEVYYDEDSDPANPGYVVRWDDVDEEGIIWNKAVTKSLKAKELEQAVDEARDCLDLGKIEVDIIPRTNNAKITQI